MGVKYSQMFNQIKTSRGLEIIAMWCPLPISWVLRSEGNLKSEMLDLAQTSKYMNNIVCKASTTQRRTAWAEGTHQT